MRTVLIGALGLMLLAASAGAAEDEDFQTPATKLILELQAAIRADDKDWFASHLHVPVRYFGKTKQIIRSKEWFLRHYTTVVGPELKATILAQDPETYFTNYQGLMVGEGGHNIWFEDFGDPGAGIPTRYEIITINNSD
jgi:hypothetical protein